MHCLWSSLGSRREELFRFFSTLVIRRSFWRTDLMIGTWWIESLWILTLWALEFPFRVLVMSIVPGMQFVIWFFNFDSRGFGSRSRSWFGADHPRCNIVLPPFRLPFNKIWLTFNLWSPATQYELWTTWTFFLFLLFLYRENSDCLHFFWIRKIYFLLLRAFPWRTIILLIIKRLLSPNT